VFLADEHLQTIANKSRKRIDSVWIFVLPPSLSIPHLSNRLKITKCGVCYDSIHMREDATTLL